jgi:hypothetical protein
MHITGLDIHTDPVEGPDAAKILAYLVDRKQRHTIYTLDVSPPGHFQLNSPGKHQGSQAVERWILRVIQIT